MPMVHQCRALYKVKVNMISSCTQVSLKRKRLVYEESPQVIKNKAIDIQVENIQKIDFYLCYL